MITSKLQNQVQILDLGLIAYADAYEKQKECVAAVQDGEGNQLILCEHPSTITCGRMSHEENFLFNRPEIEAQGVEIVDVDRGGDITLHAPGQLVVYPIFDLKRQNQDLRKYLRQLEEVVIDLLGSFGILAKRHESETGVWVGEKKLASIGIGIKKWVSYHGIGINVNTDLSLYRFIRPCGLDVDMTSIQEQKGTNVSMNDVKDKLIHSFEKIFELGT